MSELKDIRELSFMELQLVLQELGEPKFRHKQVYAWIWYKGVNDFDEMANISKSLIEKLKNLFFIPKTSIFVQQTSVDGTIKVGFKLYDGNEVEGVIIPSNERLTACISSQVGCSLDCKFCATGYLPRKRNLTAGEIMDQVKLLNDITTLKYNKKLDNIVYMGMGEPLLNYNNVVQSVKAITDMDGLGFSPKRITVSTAGISKMIVKLADENLGCKLALSLHETTNEARSKIMPINETNPLESLAESLSYWYKITKSRPTLEYTVIEGVNDSQTSASNLAAFARKFPCKVNLIEYNPIEQASYVATSHDNYDKLANFLEQNKIIVNIRRSRGKDIDAACGQLINKSM